jgi:hypothetical protein
VPLNSNFLFAMSQFDLPIAPKKKTKQNKPTEEIQGFILKYRVPPLGPTYI